MDPFLQMIHDAADAVSDAFEQAFNEFDCQVRNEWGFPIITEKKNEEEGIPRADH